jgi:hypothetical protein
MGSLPKFISDFKEQNVLKSDFSISKRNIREFFEKIYNILVVKPTFYVDISNSTFSRLLFEVKYPWRKPDLSFLLTSDGKLEVHKYEKCKKCCSATHDGIVQAEILMNVNLIIKEYNYFYETVCDWSYVTDGVKYTVDITMNNGVRRIFSFKGIALQKNEMEKASMQVFLEQLESVLFSCLKSNS